MLTLQAWREAGRPNWVVRADEQVHHGSEIVGHLFYHSWQPAYLPLDLYIGTTGFTIEVRTGLLTNGSPELQPTVVHPIRIGDQLVVDSDDMPKIEGIAIRLWDRGLHEGNAQRFTLETEDPDYVQTEHA